MSVLHVAIFGLGRAGAIHLQNIHTHPRVKLLAVIDSNPEVAERYGKQYGVKYGTEAILDEVLSDPQLEGVVICTPTHTHTKYIKASIAKGKPIFTEKPVSLTLEELDDVFHAAAKAKVPLFCGMTRRFDPSFAEAAAKVHSGAFGKPRVIKTCARDSPCPSKEYLETSHGFFHDSGVHDIDVVRWIAQEDPSEVYATAHSYDPMIKGLGDVDTLIMVFKFPSGLMATIDMSRICAYGYDQRCEVFCAGGMVQVEPRLTSVTAVSDASGIGRSKVQYSFPQRFREAYIGELDHFVEIVKDGKAPCITHDDCRKFHILAHFAKESSKTGLPIKLDYSVTKIAGDEHV